MGRADEPVGQLRVPGDALLEGGPEDCGNCSTRKLLDKFLARIARMFYVCSAPPYRPIVDPNRGVSVAGGARGPDGNKGVRRQMASQRLEKIESEPGNGMGAEASNPQDVEQGRAADRAPLRLTSRENDKAVLSLAAREAVGKASRPEMAPQRLEKIESWRENGMASKASDLQDMVHGRAADRARLRLMGRENDKVVLGRAAREAVGKTSRPKMARQGLEKIESAPENGSMSGASDPQDMVHGRAADRARLWLTSHENGKVAKLGIFLEYIIEITEETTNGTSGNPAHRAPVASRQRGKCTKVDPWFKQGNSA
jgi:hypothetical protein